MRVGLEKAGAARELAPLRSPLHFETGRVPRLNSDAASSAIHACKGLASKPSRLAILAFTKNAAAKGAEILPDHGQGKPMEIWFKDAGAKARAGKPSRGDPRRGEQRDAHAQAPRAPPQRLSSRKGNSRNVARAPSRRYGGKGREQGQESDVVRHPQGVGKGPTGAIAMTPAGLGVDIGPSARPRRSRERDNLRQLAAHQRCLAPRRGTLEPPHQAALPQSLLAPGDRGSLPTAVGTRPPNRRWQKGQGRPHRRHAKARRPRQYPRPRNPDPGSQITLDPQRRCSSGPHLREGPLLPQAEEGARAPRPRYSGSA